MKNSLAIVIPAYKITFLKETLESIANQTDKRFHLYIGDDCSPYDIEGIVNEYKSKIQLTYHRFNENFGGHDLVAQWERCIALTVDEPYIWLFSDDDTMDSHCVEDFYKAKADYPDCDVFRYNVNVINRDGNLIRKSVYPELISSKHLYQRKINGSLECFVVEYIFKRTVYNRDGGFVNFDLAWGSDLATWVKLGKKSGIRTIGKSCISWRSSGANISTDYKIDILIRKISALVDCLKWGEAEFPDSETRKINIKGLISRLSQIAIVSNYKTGMIGVRKYSDGAMSEIIIGIKYTVYYIAKRVKKCFLKV